MFIQNTKLSLLNLNTTKPHIHTGLQCLFVLKGEVVIETNENTTRLAAEDLLVIERNELHQIKAEKPNVVLLLEIDQEYIKNECGKMAKERIKCHCIGHSDENSRFYGVKKALTRMLYISVKKEEGFWLDFKVELLRCLYILFSCFQTEETREVDKKEVKTMDGFQEALTFINENYYRPIKLEEVAKREFMTPQYFSKYFKRKTGYNFLEYITAMRLKKAVRTLTTTNDSIVKIALDNGFANAKSFNEAFKKEYQDTPGNFRKQYLDTHSNYYSEEEQVEINLKVDINLKDFVRYVKRFDLNFEERNIAKKVHEIDLAKTSSLKLKRQQNLLNIGKIETSGYTNLFNQLETLRGQLNFKYVYFELEYHFIPHSIQYSLILYNQFFRAVDKFKKNGMIPFIRIAKSEWMEGKTADEVEEVLEKRVETFLHCIKAVYPKEYINTWKIEADLQSEIAPLIRAVFYRTIYRTFKKHLPKIEVGFCSTCRGDFLFKVAQEEACSPDFITFEAFPIKKMADYVPNEFSLDGLKNYYQEILRNLEEDCQRFLGKEVPLFMTKWNTLMGDLENESILYFRAALILEALLDVNRNIKGAGFWADSSVSARYSKEPPMSPLALYMLDDVRRPVYSVLEMLTRVGSKIIHRDQQLIVSETIKEEYCVLIWNPKYLNPTYSIDDATTQSLTRNINIKLKGIKPGNYQVKKVTCNKEYAGAITQIVNAGYPDFVDTEVFDYVKSNIASGYSVYEENINSGTYLFNTNLTYNSVIMFMIKRIK